MKQIELKNRPLNLYYIFESGQIFRWNRCEKGYEGFIKKQLVRVEKKDGYLFVEPQGTGTLDIDGIEEFFDLKRDYDSIVKKFDDPVLSRIYERYRGIRILKQEPLECAISFITSANNNIKRINMQLETLAERYGKRQRGRYIFPEFEVLLNLSTEDFQRLGFGYRSAYLCEFLRRLKDEYDYFMNLGQTLYKEARDYLLSFRGIGPKVADCILLYGFQHMEAFPVDVWIKRALEKYYNRVDGIANKFGNHGGLAQLLLFLDIRGV